MSMLVRPDTRSELLRSKLSRGTALILLFHAVCLGFGTPTFPISILGIFGALIVLATLAQKVFLGAATGFAAPAAGSWILDPIFNPTQLWTLNPFHMMGVARVALLCAIHGSMWHMPALVDIFHGVPNPELRLLGAVMWHMPALVDIIHGAATGLWTLNPFHMMGVAGVPVWSGDLGSFQALI